MVVVLAVVAVGGVLFVGGWYVLCWLLCVVVVNPQISHSYFCSFLLVGLFTCFLEEAT